MLFPLILIYINEKKNFFNNSLGKRAVIIYFALCLKVCKKIIKINLQLNIYPHNIFYHNLQPYIILDVDICGENFMLINFHKIKSAAEKLKTFSVLTQMLENLKFPQNGQFVFLR